ncbi:S8 family serine peptidase [Streptomyces sp. NPDC059894]|uniref:S8 family serine peptidase n=1 Tax=unclassified Streptomyces TaxID=2593676 RepID=UPI00364A2FDC
MSPRRPTSRTAHQRRPVRARHHVASIVGGSGAASDGARKGVAPGADLLVGKILGDDGSGSESAVIAGMEWAAGQGARVVSMSLSSNQPSDGSDAMSLAVDEFSRTASTLYVIAAGNNGRDCTSTVASPGAAESALAVGAVDRDDSPADFSSRGPFRCGAGPVPDGKYVTASMGVPPAGGSSASQRSTLKTARARCPAR